MSGIADFKDTLYVINILISLGAVFYVWLTARSRGNEKGLKALTETVTDLDRRVVKIEGELEHLPTKEGQHRLELAMSELAGDMKQMAEALTGTKNTVARMEIVLMDRGNKS